MVSSTKRSRRTARDSRGEPQRPTEEARQVTETEIDLLPAIKTPAPESPLPDYAAIPGPLAEAIRTLVNRYELSTGTLLPNSISVTSPLPGEGVTTISQALATMIAHEMGRFVCWVDCSWLTTAGTDVESNRPNLLDLLDDHGQIQSALQTTPGIPQLISLSPGPVPETKRNLIVRSPAFERLLNVLADEFDHVVFDLPPILTNSNAIAMLRQADASIFVVRHRSTTIAQLERAIESAQPTENLGIVLNRYRSSIPAQLRRLLGG